VTDRKREIGSAVAVGGQSLTFSEFASAFG